MVILIFIYTIRIYHMAFIGALLPCKSLITHMLFFSNSNQKGVLSNNKIIVETN